MSLMSSKERLHIEAHSGPHHLWVTRLPLSFKKYALTSPEWTAAARRRLMVNVFPFQIHCNFCKGGWCDVKGNHAIMCGGGPSRTLRHDTIRNIVARAARDVGFKTDLEHGGGLGDDRRPGDVIIYNWHDNRHLLIDVAVINPLCSSNISSLIAKGIGAAATTYEKIKENNYSDLNFSKYELLPFIVEAIGGMGSAAEGFCKELKSRRKSLSCNSEMDDSKRWTYQDPLLVALSVELQRTNSRMILERAPESENLIMSQMAKCEHSVAIRKEEAIESLRLESSLKPDRIMNREKKRPQNRKIKKNSKRYSSAGQGYSFRKQSPHIRPNTPKFWPGLRCGSGAQKSQLKDSKPPPVPDPPDPQDLNKEAFVQGLEILSSVMEERTAAAEVCQSQSTSTLKASVKRQPIPNSPLETMPWEPPGS